MAYPLFVKYATPDEYRVHFERVYCCGPITTFDGIAVRFRKDKFAHDFYESSKRDKTKDRFSWKRAERIDWIKAALEDPNSERYEGWDKEHKRYDPDRRVAVVMGNYVVVIALVGPKDANFITAYAADATSGPGRPSTLDLIRRGPEWALKNR